MKKVTKILALILAAVTLLSVMTIPTFAAYNYPMTCTVYYKNEKGKQIASPVTFTVNAAHSDASSVGVSSPSISGYVLKDSNDSYVTYEMMDKSFPASNYVRQGTATYTVVYTDTVYHYLYFVNGSTRRTIAPSATLKGTPGTYYNHIPPTVTHYTPGRTSVSGRFSTSKTSTSETIYYYRTMYTMSYNANGGSGAPSSESKGSGWDYTISSVKPTKVGYTFQGWATYSWASSASYHGGDTYKLNKNTTFYAVWSRNSYTISYNANGGTGAPSSQTKYYGTTLTLSSAKPYRTGYTFKGWGLYASSTSPVYQPGDDYNYNISRTLYAVWEKDAPPAPTTYTVSYNANGGSGAPSSQTKTKDIALTLSGTKPTRSGYTFIGWATSSSATSASYRPGGSYTANASVTLYAVWSCNHPSSKKVWDTGCDWRTVCDNCGATLSSGTLHGPYTYGDWVYYSGSQHSRYKTCIHGDYTTTEYASHNTSAQYEQYSASQHKKYSYCADCNSTVGATSYESHTFTSSTVNGQVVSICSLCGYTKTSAQTYTVSYNPNGGYNAPSSQTKVHGVTLTLSSAVPYRNNYEFVGWSASSSATTATYTAGGGYTDNASVTLYAVWRYKPATYTVTFDANGGTNAPSSQTKTYGVALTLTTAIPTRANYLFAGWSKDRNATSASYTAGGSYTDNASVTLYAVWVYSPESYTVRYDANGGAGAPSSQSKTYGVPLTLSTVKPIRVGYEFLGWATSKNATTSEYAPGERYTDEASVTFYAVWRYVPKTYTVSYDANGGSNAPGTQTKTENVALTLASTIPAREGYTFRGWATSPTATTADYQPGGSYTANAAVTLYAVWEKDSYTVSYDANGGTGAPASQVKKYGETLKLRTEIPTRSGYDFLGWAESSTATSATYLAGANYSENAGITLYAVWRERNYDFSVSNLTVTPDEVWQYDKITVNFRVDNWDRYNAYNNVPVSVWLNGVCVYTGTVDFHAYGVNYITFDLNVGALEGKQTLEARINWDDRASETRSNNNSIQAQLEVKKYSELSTSAVTPSADYIEGNDIIASFYVSNDSSTPVLPSDHMSYRLEVYLVDGATETLVSTQDKTDVVIPANRTNLVYFKWRVPENSAGKLYMFRGIANAENTVRERNPDNNATFFMKTVKAKETSQTPNTRYERTAPNTYNPLVSSPTTTVGSASWNEWVYENGKFELRTYGIRASAVDPVVKPDDNCKTAVLENGKWSMKSGYGISLAWNLKLIAMSGYSMPDSSAYTEAQAVMALIPEYGYSMDAGKYRSLEMSGGAYCFVENRDADENARLHFVPVYVANGSYTMSVTATQIWTPAGMITAIRNANTLTIDGTIYDDFYVGS